jgi:nucleoid DNA-binding protein
MKQELEIQDLVLRISKETNSPVKDVDHVIRKMLEIIAEELKKENNINLQKFGKFESKRVIRKGVKVLGKMITDLNYIEIVFKPHQTLKSYINNKEKRKGKNFSVNE